MLCGAVQDYLAAPMPFVVGLHSPNLFTAALRSSSLEEVVVVDLDRGTVRVGRATTNARWLSRFRMSFYT